MAEAKRSVFPSLVYVRVITEDRADGKLEKVQASGSGVIITEDGELLTNHHVVDRASRIRCQLTDGSMYDAKVVGKDKDLDVALLNHRPRRLSDSHLEIKGILSFLLCLFISCEGKDFLQEIEIPFAKFGVLCQQIVVPVS